MLVPSASMVEFIVERTYPRQRPVPSWRAQDWEEHQTATARSQVATVANGRHAEHPWWRGQAPSARRRFAEMGTCRGRCRAFKQRIAPRRPCARFRLSYSISTCVSPPHTFATASTLPPRALLFGCLKCLGELVGRSPSCSLFRRAPSRAPPTLAATAARVTTSAFDVPQRATINTAIKRRARK